MPNHDEYDDRYAGDYRPRRRSLDPYEEDGPSREHSRFGIASFCLALVGGVMEFILLVIAGILEASAPGSMNEDSPQAMILGAGLIGGGVLCLVGLALGIAGLCESRRKKVFAILGVVLNALAILGVGVVMLVGMMMD
jgi:hypothetical protein